MRPRAPFPSTLARRARVAAILVLLPLLGALAGGGDRIETVRADGPPTVAEAVAEIRKAVEAQDEEALKRAAARGVPDPWRVTRALCVAKAHVAARAFTKALTHPDTRGLAALVEARIAKPEPDALVTLMAWLDTVSPRTHAAEILERTATPEMDAWPFVAAQVRLVRGYAYAVQRKSAPSLVELDAAARHAEAIGWVPGLAAALRQGGLAAMHTGELDGADARWSRVLSIYEARNQQARAAGILNNLGLLQERRGQYDRALASFEKALAIVEARKDSRGIGTVLGNIGIIHEQRGDPRGALKTYLRAYRLKVAAGDKGGAALTLANIGAVHDGLGQYSKALSTYRQARELYRAVGDEAGVASVTGDIGSAHHALGAFAKAITAYEEAIAEQRRLGDEQGLSGTLGNLGGLYLHFGDYASARQAVETSLAIRKKLGDTRGAAIQTGNLGVILHAAGSLEEAQAAYREAHKTLTALGSTNDAARMLASLGTLQMAAGDNDTALATLERALEIQQAAKDRASVAWTSERLGLVQRRRGEPKEAAAYFEQSARVARSIRALPMRVRALAGLARLQLEIGESSAALGTAQQARDAAEGLFEGLGDERGARARERHASVFAVGALAAIREGDLSEAVTFLESGRAGAFRDALDKRETLRWLNASLPEALRAAEEEARRGVTTARRAYDDAVRGGKRREIRTALKALDAATGKVREVNARIQRELKGKADLHYPRAQTLEDIQLALEPGQALVIYGLCLDAAVAVVVEAESARVVDLGSARDLEAACRTLGKEVIRVDGEPPLATLRKRLVAALALPKRVTRVIVSPEGELSLLPFGALFDRPVVLMPSGSTLVHLNEVIREPGQGVLALGNPDYKGVSNGARRLYFRGSALTPLPATAEEVARVGTTRLVGADASEAGLRKALGTVPVWRAVHFACHGLVVPGKSSASSLALTPSGDDDGFLSAEDIGKMEIPADLAVLSACETGIADPIPGEGILGFTRTFMIAGAPRVLCSLWKVDDAATQALMIRFYELWNPKGKPGLPASVALRQAQAHVRAQEKWKHPYYWAAWVLWGLPN